MKRLGFAIAILSILFMGSIGSALAWSSKSKNDLPGAFVNLTDPDEKMPPFLGTVNGHTSSSENFEDNNQGQGFISKDKIEQSNARGDGSYLKPEPNNNN